MNTEKRKMNAEKRKMNAEKRKMKDEKRKLESFHFFVVPLQEIWIRD